MLMKWTAFAGILVELAGFIILAWDLLPEYRLHRQREVALRYRTLLASDGWFDAQVRSCGAAQGADATAAIEDLVRFMEVSDLEALLHHLRLEHRLPSPPDRAKFERVLDTIDAALDRRAIEARRWRAPIWTGIALVLVGVGFQLVAAWPLW
jgi:hypothetical protein